MAHDCWRDMSMLWTCGSPTVPPALGFRQGGRPWAAAKPPPPLLGVPVGLGGYGKRRASIGTEV